MAFAVVTALAVHEAVGAREALPVRVGHVVGVHARAAVVVVARGAGAIVLSETGVAVLQVIVVVKAVLTSSAFYVIVTTCCSVDERLGSVRVDGACFTRVADCEELVAVGALLGLRVDGSLLLSENQIMVSIGALALELFFVPGEALFHNTRATLSINIELVPCGCLAAIASISVCAAFTAVLERTALITKSVLTQEIAWLAFSADVVAALEAAIIGWALNALLNPGTIGKPVPIPECVSFLAFGAASIILAL